MTPSPPRRVALSSWAVHRWLGYRLSDGPSVASSAEVAGGRLLELPRAATEHQIQTLEICHFHLPKHNKSTLSDFRSQAESAQVKLFSLLIDDGDLSDPENHLRDRKWIEGWLEVASDLRFERVRVIAGKQPPTPENLARALDNLGYLAECGKQLGLRVTTENWQNLVPSPEPLLWLLESLGGGVGLCLDFGNWHGANRHQDFSRIAHLAESCHAKTEFSDQGALDLHEFRTCLEIVKNVGFDGPFTLVHGLESGEWASLAPQQEALKPYL